MVKIYEEGSGLPTIGIGAKAVYSELINGQHKGDAKFGFDTNSDPVKVTITGKAVFEKFKTREGLKKIEFICKSGSCYTILRDLNASEIYLRIKNFYYNILDNCLGKIASEQQDYLTRFNEPNTSRPLKPGEIEKSEEYICNLPESPTHAELENLVSNIQ